MIKELYYNGNGYSLSMDSSGLYHKPSLSEPNGHSVLPTPACCQKHGTTLLPQEDSQKMGKTSHFALTPACPSLRPEDCNLLYSALLVVNQEFLPQSVGTAWMSLRSLVIILSSSFQPHFFRGGTLLHALVKVLFQCLHS